MKYFKRAHMIRRHPTNDIPIKDVPTSSGLSQERIWHTSSQEEREQIKDFWLSLGDEERRALVKVEKEAVLKKIKEQQKHSCSCDVCKRKRTAIEEELEVLYDAYYEELEQYANAHGRPPPMMPPPWRFGVPSDLQRPNHILSSFTGKPPPRGRRVEELGADEEYSEEEGDKVEYSDEEPEETASDFFDFGNSLTVQGGILTVADDLLKNDGKKFIEMMEQLAERRIAREEDAKEVYVTGSSVPSHHPPVVDDKLSEEDDDYDSQDDDYDEEEMVSASKNVRECID
jgi:uncharacterized protein YcgL (UPF0745 family)